MKYIGCLREIPEPAGAAERAERAAEICAAELHKLCPEAVPLRVLGGAQYLRCDFEIPQTVAVPNVAMLEDALSVAFGGHGDLGIRICKEGRVLSVELPLQDSVVGLRAVLESEEFQTAQGLQAVLGRDVEGMVRLCDFRYLGHVLLGGDSGSGKSVFLRSMLVGMFEKYSPAELRLILFDPKMSEFTDFSDCPYLYDGNIYRSPNEFISVLEWANEEAIRRVRHIYDTAQQKRNGAYTLESYNRTCAAEERFCHIVIVIDELSFYTLAAERRTEEMLCTVTQRGRHAGIHVVAATQYPTVTVFKGAIKAGFPARICFRTSTDLGSRVVLDTVGAEKLAGCGDMLFREDWSLQLFRIKGAYIGADELRSVLHAVKEREKDAAFAPPIPIAPPVVLDPEEDGRPEPEDRAPILSDHCAPEPDEPDPDEPDPTELIRVKALATVVKAQTVSISFVQRQCDVGYRHAAKLIDWMEEMGYITAFDGSAHSRTVTLTKEMYEKIYGPLE